MTDGINLLVHTEKQFARYDDYLAYSASLWKGGLGKEDIHFVSRREYDAIASLYLTGHKEICPNVSTHVASGYVGPVHITITPIISKSELPKINEMLRATEKLETGKVISRGPWAMGLAESEAMGIHGAMMEEKIALDSEIKKDYEVAVEVAIKELKSTTLWERRRKKSEKDDDTKTWPVEEVITPWPGESDYVRAREKILGPMIDSREKTSGRPFTAAEILCEKEFRKHRNLNRLMIPGMTVDDEDHLLPSINLQWPRTVWKRDSEGDLTCKYKTIDETLVPVEKWFWDYSDWLEAHGDRPFLFDDFLYERQLDTVYRQAYNPTEYGSRFVIDPLYVQSQMEVTTLGYELCYSLGLTLPSLTNAMDFGEIFTVILKGGGIFHYIVGNLLWVKLDSSVFDIQSPFIIHDGNEIEICGLRFAIIYISDEKKDIVCFRVNGNDNLVGRYKYLSLSKSDVCLGHLCITNTTQLATFRFPEV